MVNRNHHDLDNLAFGAVPVASAGRVMSFNAAESDITGRGPEALNGENVFEAVAPCTTGPGFPGKFTGGMQTRKLDTVFEYTFDYQMPAPKVGAPKKKALTGNSCWILVKRV
ncbi:PAS domain-containing protein [Thiohalorhabdus sp.]|uniref:PAS domain-containing protein n=1 Tax=Thiohalorhabdus sp. TaxID=3094134 RepID=UPI002FC38A33